MESASAPAAALELTLPASLESGPFYDPFEKPFARRSESRKRSRTDDGVSASAPAPSARATDSGSHGHAVCTGQRAVFLSILVKRVSSHVHVNVDVC